jgi:hypothetical protein
MECRKTIGGDGWKDGRLSEAASAHLTANWTRFVTRFGPWQWFVTLTFGNPIHPSLAEDRFNRWRRLLSRDLYGPRYEKLARVYGHGLTWVLAVELQRRDVIHFHALMRGPDLDQANRFKHERTWRGVADGRRQPIKTDSKGFLVSDESRRTPHRNWARIETPRAGAVAAYCCKYVAKDGEIVMGGILPPTKLQTDGQDGHGYPSAWRADTERPAVDAGSGPVGARSAQSRSWRC